MNTTMPYNNNLNDENSKPKQKQFGSSSASPSSCTTSTSSTSSSTTSHSRSHSPWSICPSVPSSLTFSSKFSRSWNSHPPWLVNFTSNLWYPLKLCTPFPSGSLTPPTSTSLSPSSKCSRLLCRLQSTCQKIGDTNSKSNALWKSKGKCTFLTKHTSYSVFTLKRQKVRPGKNGG